MKVWHLNLGHGYRSHCHLLSEKQLYFLFALFSAVYIPTHYHKHHNYQFCGSKCSSSFIAYLLWGLCLRQFYLFVWRGVAKRITWRKSHYQLHWEPLRQKFKKKKLLEKINSEALKMLASIGCGHCWSGKVFATKGVNCPKVMPTHQANLRPWMHLGKAFSFINNCVNTTANRTQENQACPYHQCSKTTSPEHRRVWVLN